MLLFGVLIFTKAHSMKCASLTYKSPEFDASNKTGQMKPAWKY